MHDLDVVGFLFLEKLSTMTNSEITIQCFIFEMKFYYLRLTHEGRFIEFRCSYKLLPLDLKKISHDFKLSEPSTELSIFYKNTEARLEEFFSNQNNLKQFYQLVAQAHHTSHFIIFINKILTVHQNINISNYLSMPAVAFACFKKNFNKKLPLSLNKTFDTYIRPSYFGGRVEVFGNTTSNIYYYDFPGMYALCMREKFPCGSPFFVMGADIDETNLRPGFYHVSWKSNNMKFPILPLKNEEGKLVFVNGEHSGTY